MSSVPERGQAQGPVRGVGGVEKEGAFQPVEEVLHLSKVEEKRKTEGSSSREDSSQAFHLKIARGS